MAEELQGLLDRIQQDGIAKADAEKARIISDAKAQAEKIVADAKAEAERIISSSDESAKVTEQRAKAAINQAARDTIIALKAELEARMRSITKETAAAAMTPDVMSKIILEVARSQSASAASGLEAIMSRKDLDALQAQFMSSLVQNLRAKPELNVGNGMSGGLKIGFRGSDVYLDFSDEAISETLCAYLAPRIAAILQEGQSQKLR